MLQRQQSRLRDRQRALPLVLTRTRRGRHRAGARRSHRGRSPPGPEGPAKLARHRDAARLTSELTYNQMVVDGLSADEADRVFHAMADTTRRDILVRAIEREQSVSSLARHYEMSFAAVQKHVAVLERAALVKKERRGREQIVHAETSTLRSAVGLLDAYEQLWLRRDQQITELLASPKGDPHDSHQL